MSSIPKAQVSEKDGEVSCSIEETNRIRAELGLKPLKVDSPAEEARKKKKREEAARRQAEEDKAAAQVADRIRKAKEKRMSRVTGKSVAQESEADGEDVDDAAAWIMKSRKIEKEKKRQAEELAKKLASQDDMFDEGDNYTSSDLQGLKVAHDAEAIADGTSVILTLKDSSILDGGALNDGEDELENVNIAEEEKRKETKEKAKQKTIYEEAEEEAIYGKKAVLSKYDSDDDQEKQGMVLNAKGQFDESEQSRQAAVKAKLEMQEKHPGAVAYDLSTTLQRDAQTDYLTQDEVSFKKPTKKKKKKKIRKKRDDDDTVRGPSLADELEKTAVGGDSDLVSRADAHDAKRVADAEGKKESQRAYLRALRKSQGQNAELKDDYERELAAKAADDEDGDDLAATLARARRVALKAKEKTSDSGGAQGQNGIGGKKGKVSIAELARQEREEEEAAARNKKGDTVVFTEMSEFVRGLDTAEDRAAEAAERGQSGRVKQEGVKMEVDDVKQEVAAVKEEEEVKMEIDDGQARVKAENGHRGDDAQGRGWTAVDTTGEAEANEERSRLQQVRAREGRDGTEDDDAFGRQATVSSGMAATLALLKSQGDLSQHASMGGRANDRRHFLEEDSKYDEDGDIKIDYHDRFGRKLTPKEAYRQMCHTFHGMAPGKNKMAKELKAYQNELAAARGKLPSSLEALQASQAKTGEAFVRLQGGVQDRFIPPLTADALADANGAGGSKRGSGSQAGGASKKHKS